MDDDAAQALAYQCELEQRWYEEKSQEEDNYWRRLNQEYLERNNG